MMSLDVSSKLWSSRQDPRRQTPSIGSYTHLSSQWSLIYDQPIVLNERQAGVAIEGVIRQDEISIERLAVDTHGYTDFAMGQAKLLGFDLCPRLKRLNERKLHVPKGLNIPSQLNPVVSRSVSLASIEKEWDELVRVAASIETGYTSATVALARFGSAAQGDKLYKAGVALGRLVRSIYLCDYFVSESFRRGINRILVHGEAVHQLQRALCRGSFSKPRGGREGELTALSGSLTLLSNLCLTWTAYRMQMVLDSKPEWLRDAPTDWLRSVSPAHFQNINMRGTLSFPFGKYRDRLFPEVAMRVVK